MDRMNRETVLCADIDRLCGRGFPIGDGNRGHDVREFDLVGQRSLIGRRREIAVAVVGRIEGRQHSAAGGERSVLEEIEQVVVSIAGCLCVLRVSVRHGSCRGRAAEIRGLGSCSRNAGRVDADFAGILRCELARER